MTQTSKAEIRKAIAAKKQTFTDEKLREWSDILWSKLEAHPLFQRASTVLLYYSLPDEVQTQRFIEKWSRSKDIILPVVVDNDLELRHYNGAENLQEGSFHIQEPVGNPIRKDLPIDLAFIPGVSFDTHGNRLGRGKGFYDRLLKQISTHKIGVCFHFQITDRLPAESLDIPMDEVWSENRQIFTTY